MSARRDPLSSQDGTSASEASAAERDERRPYLLVLSGPAFGQLVELPPGREIVIGCGQDADLRVEDDGVAHRHATVTAGAGEARLVDAGTAEGTFHEGARVGEATLRDGSRFAIGARSTLQLVLADEVEAAYQRRLAEGALLEPLTGLYNRRHFMERLAAELAAAQRHGRSLSLLLIDVDRFRRVNEEHGHLAGDEALKLVAFVLQGAVRKEDVVARFAGQEFAVLARETGLTGARALAERLRRAVERSRASFEGVEIALTVSVGLTVSTGTAAFEPGRTEAQMLAAAGQALGRAKTGGRNTVAVVSAPA